VQCIKSVLGTIIWI